jgi:hypothetical protein
VPSGRSRILPSGQRLGDPSDTQSHNPAVTIRIPFPHAVWWFSKSGDRRVIANVGVERKRPACLLSPVFAGSCDERVHAGLSVRHSRPTGAHPTKTITRPQFRPKLSPLSESRAVRVMEGLRSLNRSQPLHEFAQTFSVSLMLSRRAEFLGESLAGLSSKHGRIADGLPAQWVSNSHVRRHTHSGPD